MSKEKNLKINYKHAFLIIFAMCVSSLIALISGLPFSGNLAMAIIVGIIVMTFLASMFGEEVREYPMEEGVFIGTLEKEEFLGVPAGTSAVDIAGKKLYFMDFERYDKENKKVIRKRVVFLYGSPDRTDLLVPVMQDGMVVRRVLRGFRLTVSEAAKKLLIGRGDPWLVHLEGAQPLSSEDIERELMEKFFDADVSEVIFYAPYAPSSELKEFLENGLKVLSDMNFKIADERIRTVKVLERVFDEFRSSLSRALEVIIPLTWKIADSYVDGLDLAALIITRGVSGLESLKLEQIANMRDIDTQLAAMEKIKENLKKYKELISSIEIGEKSQSENIRDEIYELKRQIASLASKIEGATIKGREAVE